MEKIIVSFTSYPKRIMTIDKVIDSIIKQTILPDKIVLYLSVHEFRYFNNMPDLKRYEKYGFEIHWCSENLKSHKKWFYALQEYPDDIIITIDDDIIYCNTALENLLKYHEIYTKAIIARRVHLITCNQDNLIASYNDWYMECERYIGIPRMDLFATTGAGALFPPHIFSKEIFRKDLFMQICPYSDDIWIKIIAAYNKVPVVLAKKSWEDCVISIYQNNCLFENYNKDGGNDKQLKALLKQYTHTYDGMVLENYIFSQEKVFSSNVNELKIIDMENALNQLILKIHANDKILIYGAGVIGRKIYDFFKYKNIDSINKFIVSSPENNPDFIGNILVKSYKQFIKSSEKIVLALWDTYESHRICEKLIEEGISKDRFIFLSRIEKQALLNFSL